MKRVNLIYEHPVFQEKFQALQETEKERKFCKHTLEHLLDVARLMYIYALEHDLSISKELIYATALMHDIGRIDQIENGVIKSTVNGTVTQVNIKAGDIYTGSTIAVIEGCEDFIVEAEIDEYDIPDISVGMRVLIKTDATRDEELEGRVIYTAPSATTASTSSSMGAASSSATSGSSATYTVKISLDTPNDRLRLGMNAKLSIITESKEDVWSVPYDAVYDREDGTHYIEILKNEETEEIQEITVEKGLEGTYYVEISSDELKEGIRVVHPKIEAGNSMKELI